MRNQPLRDSAIEELNRLAVGSSKDQLADQAAVAALLAAEFALDERKGQQALMALAPLTQKESRQVHTMRLALRANQQVGNWDEVLRIARLLMNRKAITPTVAIHYKQRVADAWIADGRHQEAIALIEQVLKNNWDSGLAMRYGRCEGVAKDQLTQLERWLKAHPQDPELHWALGRLCQRERLWGKARLHLETSLRVRPMVETHLALAEIAESLSESDTAALHWKAAARLV
jgi:HemY protein